ncbi:hypothetical protein KDL01_37605 [Actinospica durhamensis]|uniref:Glyoxalase-like domain-containing protein n=1 Tax=Actinospica durhamensis TaxID=1508375 RepID=A0A941EYV4_9ACTN|nr:VOC family protein [Actinospica durhamensis]MBR7839043.1 hypothetical protein [Actinospica durhamensis]
MLTGIVFDARDAAALEAFWREATRGETSGLNLRFVETAAPTSAPSAKSAGSGKNRLHLDLAGGPGWSAEVERLLALGATRADIGQGDVPWDVLADPEGNEFCVMRPGHPGIRVERGLAQICLDVAEPDRFSQLAFWSAESGWHSIDYHPRADRLRRSPADRVCLVLGPPAAPKNGRNRVRLEVTNPEREPGEFLDPGGNEFCINGINGVDGVEGINGVDGIEGVGSVS